MTLPIHLYVNTEKRVWKIISKLLISVIYGKRSGTKKGGHQEKLALLSIFFKFCSVRL